MAFKQSARAGIDIREFWELTPYELSIKIEAFIDNEKELVKRSLQNAWLTIAWDRTKRLPKLEEVFKQIDGKQEMTDKQMLQTVKRLNSIFGGAINGGI